MKKHRYWAVALREHLDNWGEQMLIVSNQSEAEAARLRAGSIGAFFEALNRLNARIERSKKK